MYLTEKFARLVVNTAYEDLPSRAVEKAKECILDCVGVAIAGSAEPVRGPLLHYLSAIGGPAEATIIGLGRKTSITNAALVNGVFGHVLDSLRIASLFTRDARTKSACAPHCLRRAALRAALSR